MKFGEQKSYQVGDPVFVKNCPRYGAATITAVCPAHYSVEFARYGGIVNVETVALKPATAKDVKKWKDMGEAERKRDEENRKRTHELMIKASKAEPYPVDPNDDNPTAAMFKLMAMAAQDPDQELAAIKLADAIARGAGEEGIFGKRMDYDVGERVRLLRDIKDVTGVLVQKGAEGTVVPLDPMILIFPEMPGQPRGVEVQWDTYPKQPLLCYCTHVEPV